MERRRFLQLLGLGVGGIALEQAIPLGRVWSFPKEIVIARPATVRFVRVWNPYRSMMVSRLDVLYGWSGLPEEELPQTVETAEQITVPSEGLVEDAVKVMVAKFELPVLPPLRELGRVSKNDPEIRGFWCEEPFTPASQSRS
ncbi:MAG TPA: hypothetical protein VFF58_00655 [Candidatus Nitrosotalea sp.]|nr:hypothetical protein [Candidatus Nitrosotalea sp.]